MTTTAAPVRTAERDAARPLMQVDNLSVHFGEGAHMVRAVDEVSLEVFAGDIYALVGESGCGKSTLAYSMLDLVPEPGEIGSGEVRFSGERITGRSTRDLSRIRAAQVAMVFQAAQNAFNPVLTIGRQVRHIIEAHSGHFDTVADGRQAFERLLEIVRLDPARVWDAYESQLSGGMKQRVAIAVSLLLNPSLLILDEPTTALDVLSQRLVIDILKDLHDESGVTIVFVTHDLAVVAELATKVGVLYAGRLVENGTVEQIFSGERRHPYVTGLIDAIPSINTEHGLARSIPGQVPNLAALPPGCRFAPRCPLAVDYCKEVEPTLLTVRSDHPVACHVINETVPDDWRPGEDKVAAGRQAPAHQEAGA